VQAAEETSQAGRSMLHPHTSPKKQKASGKSSEPELDCPETCTPKERVVPDIVIPFFERDLCKLKYTARSLGAHDPDRNLGDVYLMWVSNNPASDYKEDLAGVMKTLSETRKVHLIDFSTAMKSYDLDGWHAQQLLKLKIASVVKSPYYLVMDSKNTLIKDVQGDTFFNKCNQARIFAQFNWTDIPSPHNDWYKKAAKTLGVDPPVDKPYPASITPILLHKKTVLDMLAFIGEGAGIMKLCDGPMCPLFGVGDTSGQGTTEFTMYNMFSYTKTKLECTSVPEKHSADSQDQWGLSLWRGVAENQKQVMVENMETLRNITQGTLQPIMFGSQPSALDALSKEQRAEAEGLLEQIYAGAGAYQKGKTTTKALVDCAIGSYEYGKNEKKFN